MQVSLENTNALERRMTVSLPADRLEGVIGNRLREIARTANIKGFRPGKVPTKVIEQRFGAQVRNEAFGELIRETFDEAVRQEKLQPAGNPDIQAEPSGDTGEIRYTATFEVVPDFGAIDVKTLKFDRTTATVADSDVDAMLETLRQQRRILKRQYLILIAPDNQRRHSDLCQFGGLIHIPVDIGHHFLVDAVFCHASAGQRRQQDAREIGRLHHPKAQHVLEICFTLDRHERIASHPRDVFH